jgi:hypothetical protein
MADGAVYHKEPGQDRSRGSRSSAARIPTAFIGRERPPPSSRVAAYTVPKQPLGHRGGFPALHRRPSRLRLRRRCEQFCGSVVGKRIDRCVNSLQSTPAIWITAVRWRRCATAPGIGAPRIRIAAIAQTVDPAIGAASPARLEYTAVTAPSLVVAEARRDGGKSRSAETASRCFGCMPGERDHCRRPGSHTEQSL